MAIVPGGLNYTEVSLMSREKASTPLVILISYAVYAAFATLSFVFVLKWVQETKGKELEAME